jgi:hypothetical protein
MISDACQRWFLRVPSVPIAVTRAAQVIGRTAAIAVRHQCPLLGKTAS